MTSNPFDAQDSSRSPLSTDSASHAGVNQPGQPQRDRFELLSAYLDGEVTANERRQVEAWLKHDPQVQCLYSRLLKLRHGMQALPIPADCPIEQTVERVLSQIDRRPRKLMVWGGMAIAAMFVGAVSLHLPGTQHATSQIATTPAPQDSGALMIALDRPVIEIPKAPVSPPPAAATTAQSSQIR
ncbi:MAG: Fis family transcriptional regulator [Microcoleus sp. SIO2G3]|nr:Fis family transcriptional regulator [Microcoleus sp. SIO2G3]